MHVSFLKWNLKKCMIHLDGVFKIICLSNSDLVKMVIFYRACALSKNLVVLVNDRPTQEICIKFELKQGGHLDHFLLLVAKG